MPQELVNPVHKDLDATHADNLDIFIRQSRSEVFCQWDIGIPNGGTGIAQVFSRNFTFRDEVDENGDPIPGHDYFTQLATRKDFKATQTNHKNIRRVMYAALKYVGQM